MSTPYQVVYTGELKPGTNGERAARDFAAVFKVPDEKAWKLVLGGTERVLKKDVDQVNAERYRELLDEIGLVVRVEPVGGGQAEPDASPPPGEPASGGYADAKSGTRLHAGPSVRSGAAASAPKVDPYAPPKADLTKPRGGSLGKEAMTGPHTMPAGHGWQWIVDGFELFKGAPLAWIGAVVLMTLLNILLSLIPVIGGLIGTLIGPVFLGGLMLGAETQASGGRLRVGDVFSGFSAKPGRLFALGGIYLLGVFAIAILVGVLVSVLAIGVSGIDPTVLEQQDPTLMIATLGPMVLLALLFVLLLLVPLMMAYWFAPALVVLEDLLPLEAMKLSFSACWMNIMPFLVFGLAAFVLLLVGMIPFGMGLFIVSPVLVASIYTGYRDIFYRRQRA